MSAYPPIAYPPIAYPPIANSVIYNATASPASNVNFNTVSNLIPESVSNLVPESVKNFFMSPSPSPPVNGTTYVPVSANLQGDMGQINYQVQQAPQAYLEGEGNGDCWGDGVDNDGLDDAGADSAVTTTAAPTAPPAPDVGEGPGNDVVGDGEGQDNDVGDGDGPGNDVVGDGEDQDNDVVGDDGDGGDGGDGDGGDDGGGDDGGDDCGGDDGGDGDGGDGDGGESWGTIGTIGTGTAAALKSDKMPDSSGLLEWLKSFLPNRPSFYDALMALLKIYGIYRFRYWIGGAIILLFIAGCVMLVLKIKSMFSGGSNNKKKKKEKKRKK